MTADCFVTHCASEHNWGAFPCTFSNCKFEAYNQYCLKTHLRSHITENTGKYLTVTCPRKNCGMRYKSNSNLQVHLNVHDNILIKCTFCSWAGAKFFHYSDHMNTHFKMKSYKCTKCSKAFYRSDHFNTHVEQVHARN